MIGCESEPLSLKSEYAFNMSWHNMNASRKSKRELIVKSGKREQEIAVKYLLLVKNVLAVLPTGYGKSLIFTLFLLARENIITRINTDGRRVFIATGLTGLLRLGLLAASLSELLRLYSLIHGFVRETRQFILATDVFMQQSICSIRTQATRLCLV